MFFDKYYDNSGNKMALIVPKKSEAAFLKSILNISTPDDLEICLYTNNKTPGKDDDASMYAEAKGGGYTAKTLTPAQWSIASDNLTEAVHPKVSWTFKGPVGNVFGYFVVRKGSRELLWAERFNNGPYNVQDQGNEIRVSPRLSLE